MPWTVYYGVAKEKAVRAPEKRVVRSAKTIAVCGKLVEPQCPVFSGLRQAQTEQQINSPYPRNIQSIIRTHSRLCRVDGHN
ncbi:hypothetical protein [Propionivibrio sp.]|uniref:hypothetical protein n=1 Tax=Propionivibrio sp. TaxID=2212460 RepID=UPI003BEFCE11